MSAIVKDIESENPQAKCRKICYIDIYAYIDVSTLPINYCFLYVSSVLLIVGPR